MKFHINSQALGATLVIAGTLGVQATPSFSQNTLPSSPLTTTFQCIPMGGGYATVAQRDGRTTPPMITWNSQEFGPNFTPQQRCNIVTERLTKAVATNGGKLRNLQLTYGRIRGIPVICHVNSRTEGCNNNNLLLTLRASDRGKERLILKQLVNFSVKGSGTAVQQSAPQDYAPIGEAIERSLEITKSIPDAKPSPPLKVPDIGL